LVIVWVSNLHTYLFKDSSWIILIAIIGGAAAGIFRAKAKLRHTESENNPPRHRLFSFMEHWGTGIGIIILIASGRMLGFIFAPHVNGNSVLGSNLHFTGLLFTLLFGSAFLADFLASKAYRTEMPTLVDIWDGTIKKYLFKKKWTDTGKYLSSQKSAFLAFAVLGLGVLITGAGKMVSFVSPIPPGGLEKASLIHDVFAILFMLMLIVHILIVVAVGSYRRLLYSWFTGRDGIRH
jgi:formate dehydrogenase subunit gamma